MSHEKYDILSYDILFFMPKQRPRTVLTFWQELLLTDAEQVVLVTHAGVIRALLAHVLQLPLANAFKFKVDMGSVHKLQHINDYTFVHFLNH